jgi:hypothetical protein
MQEYATLIAIALVPFGHVFYRVIARFGLIAAKKYLPDSRLKKLLIRNR